MDQEVANTLGNLELKLAELERELTSIGRREEPAGTPGKLVDEAIEREPSFEQPPPVEPSPSPPSPPFEERQSIDIADLVRFRDKLAHTMDELIDEYSRLLSLQPPASSQRPPDA